MGYINEYYKQFATILTSHLHNLLNFVATFSSIPKEMLKSVITTRHKPGKDPEHVQNYRLISRINIDVKLYPKVIAERLIPLLPSLIHPDQVGFIPGLQAPDASLIHNSIQKIFFLCFFIWFI